MLELLEHQKKLTANQWKIAAAATLGDMLDFFDFFLIGFVLAFIVKELAPDLWPVGRDPARLGHQCAVRLAVLGLAGRQDRPPHGDDHAPC